MAIPLLVPELKGDEHTTDRRGARPHTTAEFGDETDYRFALAAHATCLTSILPVTAAAIRALRRSLRSAIACSASPANESSSPVRFTMKATISFCSGSSGTGNRIDVHASMRSALVP